MDLSCIEAAHLPQAEYSAGSGISIDRRVCCNYSQVQRLQRELGDAHAADYNTLKRAYVTLVQNFRALQIEAQVFV